MASNFYRAKDAPRFMLGHGLELAFIGLGLLASTALLVGYTVENKKREKRIQRGALEAYSPEELSSMGDRAVTFRYKY